MKNPRRLLWLISLIVLLLLIPFIVPSPVMSPDAGAESVYDAPDVYDVPAYVPVELENPDAELPDLPKGTSSVAALKKQTPWLPYPDKYVRDEAGNLTGYVDGTISVRVEEKVLQGTKVLFTWVQIADANQFRPAVNGRYPNVSDVRPTNMAKELRAVLAINGDYFTDHNFGVIYRNGNKIRRSKFGELDALIIDFDGNFHILKAPSLADFDAYEGQIMHSFVFGPGLVIDGEMQTFGKERQRMNVHERHQRQILCQMDELSYLIISTEGPEQTDQLGGFTVVEAAQLAYDCGAKQAYNLDGGSSTWLLLDNTRINNLGSKNMRYLIDMIYFTTADTGNTATDEKKK